MIFLDLRWLLFSFLLLLVAAATLATVAPVRPT